MQSLYQPASAVEGHMLADLLRQQGIEATVLGEHLQGAIGELPAAGLIRLVVAEEDHARAREIIERWEATAVVDPVQRPAPSPSSSRHVVWGLAGLLIGGALCLAWLRAPTRETERDHNQDGLTDERWTLSPAGSALESHFDRNFDGRMDARFRYDGQGQVSEGESDDDFDGVFESHHRYRLGNPVQSEIDTDGDRLIDQRLQYTHGVLDTVVTLQPRTGLPTRVEHLRLSRIDHVDRDTDLDGTLDLREHHNALGQVTRTERLATP
ncbi:MAG: DUF2007 domain-containing protein [Hydrogenophaga sp.]|uniref:putative signal transducing protein n=1 Tax=Hydrogenophaga sp. TaxID=1904254 RepID=UPI0025C08362|nr:DUF2007 domain-containing protein [Hydrogenophaga sp.]MBT9552373.1 DUF2007 domain-containing protein [Hydrogenophaga sp.]